MRVENFGANSLAQTDPKVKAKEQAFQAQMENVLANYSVSKAHQPDQPDSGLLNASQGAQADEG
jgi:hypothetical protein